MPEPITARVDVRKALFATAVTLADSGHRVCAATGPLAHRAVVLARLKSAEQSLIRLAEALAASVNRRFSLDPGHPEALLVLKVDSRDLEAFSSCWLETAAPPPSPHSHWETVHLVNTIDFGRWVVALSAAALTAHRGDPKLHERAVHTILALDLALAELTRALLGRRAEGLAAWHLV